MQNCPYFECLSHSSPKCDRLVACAGCRMHSDCDYCSRQATVVDGTSVPCVHMVAHNTAPQKE